MTAGQSSEENDDDQVRATIGLAGGCALQRAAWQIYEFTA
ncbi:MAG: hypothetical protein QOD11_1330 [Bradyrhizobium sp.]|jgi:hypothetical protein|nr:hypothetical protein [Bradyrhizobium sp.]